MSHLGAWRGILRVSTSTCVGVIVVGSFAPAPMQLRVLHANANSSSFFGQRHFRRGWRTAAERITTTPGGEGGGGIYLKRRDDEEPIQLSKVYGIY